jgi:glycosyltransferase 2 family protein
LKRPRGRAILRLTVAAGLTAYILRQSDPAAVAAAAAGLNWRPVGIAVLLVFADRALMAYRWVSLLCTIDTHRRPPIAPLMRVFFVSTFVGTFLPASIGGDIVRSYSLTRLNVDPGDAIASVLMDRLLGVASILLMAIAGLVLARELADNAAIVSGLVVTALTCAVALLVIFSPGAAAAVAGVTARLPFEIVRRTGARILDSIRKYAAHSPQLVSVLAGSVAVQALRVVQAYFLGRGLGIEAGLSTYFAFVPLILLVMLLPITFNGIGTSQAAFVWFFGQAGVSPAAAFALSVLFVALGVVGNLPGALLYVLAPAQPEARQPAS